MKSVSIRLIVILLLWTVFGTAFAQNNSTRKPDKIYKLDQTSIEVLIVGVNKLRIEYNETNDPKGPLYGILSKDVWKIEWNTGEIEEINKLPEIEKETFKPNQLLIKRKRIVKVFWEKSGPYIGARIGGGIAALPQTSPELSGNMQVAYSGGLTLGYHKKSLAIQIEALYTQLKFGVIVPESLRSSVKTIQGLQSNLLIPLTVTASKKFQDVRLGATVGGFGAMKMGNGSLKVTDHQNNSVNTENCKTCSDTGLAYGIVAGVAATVLERRRQSVFVDARWYHNLGSNKNYRIGENGIHAHTGVLSAGILFHFPN